MTAEGNPRSRPESQLDGTDDLTLLERFFSSLSDEQRGIVSNTIRMAARAKAEFLTGKVCGVIEVGPPIDPEAFAATDELVISLRALATVPGGEFSDEQISMMWELREPTKGDGNGED